MLIETDRAAPAERPDWEHRGKGWVRALPDEPGVQDWRGICAAFKTAGYDGLVTVVENGWPPERRVAVATRCAEAMRRFWNGGSAGDEHYSGSDRVGGHPA